MNRVVGVNGTGGREDTKQKVSQDVIHIVTFKSPTFKFKILRSSLRLIKQVFSGSALTILRVFLFRFETGFESRFLDWLETHL